MLFEAQLLVNQRREIVYIWEASLEKAKKSAKRMVGERGYVIDVFSVPCRYPVYSCDDCGHATHDAFPHPVFEGRHLCRYCAGDPDGPDTDKYTIGIIGLIK